MASVFHLSNGAATVARLVEQASDPDDTEIAKLMSSTSDRDRRTGARAILGRLARGQNCTQWFADVVRSSQSTDPRLKAIVAAYLVRYSDSEPELALLAVNALQRNLADSNPASRAQALKTLSSLRVADVAPIVLHAVRDLAADPQPLVRAEAARAVRKCHLLDPSLAPELIEILAKLMSDTRDASVVGWALVALAHEFPSRLELIHPVFRYTAAHLPQFDELCQADICRLLVRYCRHYMSGPEDPDLDSLYHGLKPLLMSTRDDVVLAAASAFHYLGRHGTFKKMEVARRVLALRLGSAVLPSITALATCHPGSFEPLAAYLLQFLPTEPQDIQAGRIRAFGAATSRRPLTSAEFRELTFIAVATQHLDVTRAALQVIAEPRSSLSAQRSVKWLVSTVTEPRQAPNIVSEALVALRTLLATDDSNGKARVLAQLSDRILSSSEIAGEARATVVWLFGEHAAQNPSQAAELLRRLARTIAEEPSPMVRLQTFQLAAKLAVASPDYSLLVQWTLHLGRYDPDYDVRDRTRFFSSLLGESGLAKLVLQPPKPMSISDLPQFDVGSASLVVGHALAGYSSLEDWAGAGDSSLRDEPKASVNIGVTSSVEEAPVVDIADKTRNISLEEFLASGSNSSSGVSSEEESELEGRSDENDSASEAESDLGTEYRQSSGETSTNESGIEESDNDSNHRP